MNCEIPKFNSSDKEIAELLKKFKKVAVVGISPKEERPSHWIAKYLIDHGYDVVGVNPGMKDFFGHSVYKSLTDVPDPVEIVDIFRRPEEVPEIVEEAIKKNAKVIWMQEGIVNNAAAERAKAAGMIVVMNKCIYREHANLI